MLFFGIAYFKQDSASRHAALRSAFTDHLSQPLNPRIRLAGAMLDDAGVQSGIFMILEADSLETARAYVDRSPYKIAGLYERVDITAAQLEVGHL